MLRKVLLLSLVWLTMLLGAGCWDRTEVDKLAIVVGLGFDKLPGENQYLLTAQIVNPPAFQRERGTGKERPFIVKYAQGVSVYDALRNFSLDSPRRMFFSQTHIIVIGDRMARSGIQPLLDFMERDKEFRRTTWMTVTHGTAKGILETELELNNLPSVGLTTMIREFQQSSETRMSQRKNFMKNLLGKSNSAYAVAVDLVDAEGKIERKLKNGEEGSIEPAKKDGSQKQLRIMGVGLFQKDRLVGYMNDAETRGLIWILGKLRGGSINVPCPEGHHQEISFRVNETKRYLTPSFNGNRLKLQLEIEEESSIKEIGCPEMDASKPEIIAKLQELESRTIERRITNAVRRAQEAKADVVQFGNAFYHKDPKKWKGYVTQWPELLAKVDFSVHVSSYIRHIGMSGKPVNLK